VNAHQGSGTAWIGLMAALLVGLGVSAPCPGQCQYEVTIIQAEECEPYGYPPTIGLGLNELGHVVGYYPFCVIGHDVPFLWTPETGMIDLPLPPDSYEATAEDINDTGQIVGTMTIADVGLRGFFYDNGEYTVLPPVIPDAGWSTALAINNEGQVVGYRSIGEEINPYNAYIWSAEDGFTDLGVMEGPYSGATGISDTGVVIGWTGQPGVAQVFIWQDGTLFLLGAIPGGDSSFPGGVNSRGHVVGAGLIEETKRREPVLRGFVWANGAWTFVDPLPDYDGSSARGLNDLRQVVGQCYSPNAPGDERAFLWQERTTYDLNELIESGPGWKIERGHAANNAGQIIAEGRDYDFNTVSFLLTPLDRPVGDITGDCDVDVADLLFVLGDWGKTDSPADINADGIVNVFDLLALLADWGT
jgi:probable HAF family extracellular repeat protein